MKLLIDECLSPALVKLAIAKGHEGTSHVVWQGKAGWKDWDLMPFILNGDWTFVTRNSVDFRGAADAPGLSGLYAGVDLHAGLICLNGPEGMKGQMQGELFARALDELSAEENLINQGLEVLRGAGGETELRRYKLPKESV